MRSRAKYYREPLRVEQPSTATAARDAFGHIDETAAANWSTYKDSVSARMQYGNGGESNADERQDGVVGGTAFVRYSDVTKAITRTMRLVPLWDTTRAWNIVSVSIDHIGQEVRIDWREDT